MEYCDEYSLLNKCNINFIASKKIDIIESDIADKKNIEFAVQDLRWVKIDKEYFRISRK